MIKVSTTQAAEIAAALRLEVVYTLPQFEIQNMEAIRNICIGVSKLRAGSHSLDILVCRLECTLIVKMTCIS